MIEAPRSSPSATETTCDRMGGVLLMAGGPRPSELAMAAGVATLDLSVDGHLTLLETWLSRIEALAGLWEPDALVHVSYSAQSARPSAPLASCGVQLRIEQEERDFRGPAGLARDVFESLHGSALVLVIEGGRYAGCDLTEFVERHLKTGADITVAMNPDSTPAGVVLLRRSTLDLAPPRGFMDLKEQWLQAALDAGHDVRVCRMPSPGIAVIRSREDLLRAGLGSLGGAGRVVARRSDAARFNVVAPSAVVSERAIVADSLVMAGAEIREGAVVVRSVVCPGAVVSGGEQAIDAVVRGAVATAEVTQ